MKHILNNLSEEEKNSIREQHEGGKKIVIENFKNLIETKSGDVKLFLNENPKTIIGEGEGIVPTHSVSDYVKEPGKGTWVVENGKFYITDETGRKVASLK